MSAQAGNQTLATPWFVGVNSFSDLIAISQLCFVAFKFVACFRENPSILFYSKTQSNHNSIIFNFDIQHQRVWRWC